MQTKACDISPSNAVLVKKPFSMVKESTVYNPNPMTVVQKKGSIITARNEDTTITRNSSFFFKKLTQPTPPDENDTNFDTPPVKE